MDFAQKIEFYRARRAAEEAVRLEKSGAAAAARSEALAPYARAILRLADGFQANTAYVDVFGTAEPEGERQADGSWRVFCGDEADLSFTVTLDLPDIRGKVSVSIEFSDFDPLDHGSKKTEFTAASPAAAADSFVDAVADNVAMHVIERSSWPADLSRAPAEGPSRGH